MDRHLGAPAKRKEPFGIVGKDSHLYTAGRSRGRHLESMRGGNRFFSRGFVNHIYQRPIEASVLFYSISDYLVYFTILCTQAAKYNVRILKLCQMPDHIHGSWVADRKRDLFGLERDITSLFAREHNRVCHRTGPFFQSPFGSTPKYTEKKARSNLIYVDNNPVERRLCEQAEQYRWNYIAYAVSDHPFSEPFRKEEASRPMIRAVRTVKSWHAAGRHLPYAMLQQMFKPLGRKEREQLVDMIISTYSVIDHEGAIRFFGSYEKMLLADHSTTGSEHDLKESFLGTDDRWYARMTTLVMKKYGLVDIHEMLAFSPDRKWDLFQLLRQETMAPADQIAAFLRFPIRREKKKRQRPSSAGDSGMILPFRPFSPEHPTR